METNGKMRTCSGRILALAAAELAVCAATAATTAFYPFDEGAPGTDVASVLNAVDSTLYSGTPSQIASGQMPAYSSDIPGGWIYSDIYRTNLLSSSANSVTRIRGSVSPVVVEIDTGRCSVLPRGIVTLEATRKKVRSSRFTE